MQSFTLVSDFDEQVGSLFVHVVRLAEIQSLLSVVGISVLQEDHQFLFIVLQVQLNLLCMVVQRELFVFVEDFIQKQEKYQLFVRLLAFLQNLDAVIYNLQLMIPSKSLYQVVHSGWRVEKQEFG